MISGSGTVLDAHALLAHPADGLHDRASSLQERRRHRLGRLRRVRAAVDARVGVDDLAGLEHLLEPAQVALDLRAREQVSRPRPRRPRPAASRRRPRSPRPPRIGRNVTRPRCGCFEPRTVHHSIRSPGWSSTTSASQWTVLPVGKLRHPPRATAADLLDRREVAHEHRQLLEVEPERVHVSRRAVDRDRADDRLGHSRPHLAGAPAGDHVERGHAGDRGDSAHQALRVRALGAERPRQEREIDRIARDARPQRERRARQSQDAQPVGELARTQGTDRSGPCARRDGCRSRGQARPRRRDLGEAQADAEPAEPSREAGASGSEFSEPVLRESACFSFGGASRSIASNTRSTGAPPALPARDAGARGAATHAGSDRASRARIDHARRSPTSAMRTVGTSFIAMSRVRELR